MKERESREQKRIAVLIPCYNESQTIEKVVRDYKNALPEADIYVYDNNSTDSKAGGSHCAPGVPAGKGKRNPQYVPGY